MKQFSYKDKTGRGNNGTLIQKNLLGMENTKGYFGDRLHEYAKYCELGEEWEDNASKFRRTK